MLVTEQVLALALGPSLDWALELTQVGQALQSHRAQAAQSTLRGEQQPSALRINRDAG
jgi:hypothetical protein